MPALPVRSVSTTGLAGASVSAAGVTKYAAAILSVDLSA